MHTHVTRVDARSLSDADFSRVYASDVPVLLSGCTDLRTLLRRRQERMSENGNDEDASSKERDLFDSRMKELLKTSTTVPVSLSDTVYDGSKRTTMTVAKFLEISRTKYACTYERHSRPYERNHSRSARSFDRSERFPRGTSQQG